MRIGYRHGWMALALGLALGGCEQAAEVTAEPDGPMAADPSRIEALSREVIALKARESDPDRLEAGLRELLPRHGFPVPEAKGGPVPSGAESAAGTQAGGVAGPLEKSAATYIDTWINAKAAGISLEMAGSRTFTVPAFVRLDVSTSTYNAAPADPVLIAFSRNGGTATAHKINIHAYNDDQGDGSLNARISWTNRSLVAREITVVTFAKSFALTGSTRITYKLSNGTEINVAQAAIWAAPTYNHPAPPIACQSPKASRIRLVRNSGGGWNSTVLAINLTTMRGGLIRERSGVNSQTLQLDDVLGNGLTTGFIVGYIPGMVDPLQVDNGYSGYQDHLRACLVPGL